jgi:NAD(P)H-hydrate repair Nnr-like enzyme with NAD(P)H-hydrate dehydratase domain
MSDKDGTAERLAAWQCIGCGRIEGARPCIGICEDRKVEFVYAADHDEALAQLARAREEAKTLAALVRRLAVTTPHEGEWKRTYRALQERARELLRMLSANVSA